MGLEAMGLTVGSGLPDFLGGRSESDSDSDPDSSSSEEEEEEAGAGVVVVVVGRMSCLEEDGFLVTGGVDGVVLSGSGSGSDSDSETSSDDPSSSSSSSPENVWVGSSSGRAIVEEGRRNWEGI